MNLRKLIFTENPCYKTGRTITPKGVMWHSTGANNPELRRYVNPDDGYLGENKYNNHWNQKMSRSVCVHAFIGKAKNGEIATYQTLPWNHRGWHCASGKNGSGNNTHISFEICEDGLNDKNYAMAVYQEALELTAYLCKMYNLNPLGDGVIIDHAEGYRRGIASNHMDVLHWFRRYGITLDKIRKDVAALMAKPKPEPKPEPKPDPVVGTLHRVMEATEFKQVGAYRNKTYAQNHLKDLESKGKVGKIVEV